MCFFLMLFKIFETLWNHQPDKMLSAWKAAASLTKKRPSRESRLASMPRVLCVDSPLHLSMYRMIIHPSIIYLWQYVSAHKHIFKKKTSTIYITIVVMHPFLCHVSWDPVLVCTSRPWRAHDIRVHVVFQVSAVISSNRPMVSQITGKPKPHMTKQ